MKRRPWEISRRTFLGGAGALLALPMLDAMAPSIARAEATPATRFLTYYVPNGIHMAGWTPTGAGTGFELGPILRSLEPLREHLMVLTGLANLPARPDGPGDHAAGTGSFLTCTHVVKTEGADIQNGISADQVAANVLGMQTRFSSLQLGVEGGGSVGGCDSGYSCAYARNISWAGPTTPLPKVVNPQVVFDRLFSGLDPRESAEQRSRRKRLKTSLLDYVRGEASTLQGRLGATDRRKVDEYLTSVRELEVKVQSADDGAACELVDRPPSEVDFPEHLRIMADIMVLAMQCDLTRVISFMLGNAGSGRSYSFLGVSGAHHELSHHQNNPDNWAALQAINTFEVEQLAYLLTRMAETPDGDGSLLDHAVVFFSSEIEDGNAHRHTNLPVLLAGGARGYFNTGRHVVYDGEPIADLFISVLESLGVSVPGFGDNGTGPLANLR